MQPPPQRRSPGSLAQQVLTIVRETASWVTVREVHGAIAAERDTAYTTVLTVMQRLVQQGHLDYQRAGRTGEFRSSQNADPLAARSLVDQALARFGTVAITQFVERTREDPALLAELRKQLGVTE